MEINDKQSDETTAAFDVLVSRAMDRVLQSESAAQTAVAECERTCAGILEEARQQARSILETAQRRIVALHTRAARGLELGAAEIIEARRKSTAAAVGQLSDPARRSTALDRLAARLTSTEEIRTCDGT